MRKYFAVVKDSFREALASRVLWILLLLVTVLLAAVAPLGYREVLTFRLRDSDVQTWPDFMDLARTEGPVQDPSPIHHLWSELDKDLQVKLRDVKIPGKGGEPVNPMEFIGAMSRFQRAVNKMIRDREFFDETQFAEVLSDPETLPEELRELREEGLDKLSDEQITRFNRLLMEASFPDLIRQSSATSIQWTYAWGDVLSPQPLRGAMLRDQLANNTVSAITWLLGVFGVFVAILVTAYIIPQMFQSGSLHLLISKPIARWALFLAKYLGGCCFILIVATYLIGGFWMILGVRFGVWESKLLYAIPVYLFVFAIYYAVSALSGLMLRSPIASIGITMLFFAACLSVEWAKSLYDQAVLTKDRFVDFVETDDGVIAVSELGISHRWDEEQSEWSPVFMSDEQKQTLWVFRWVPVLGSEVRPVGPIYAPEQHQLIAALPSFSGGQRSLYIGIAADNWNAVKGINTPRAVFAMFEEPQGSLLFVSPIGVYRLVGNPLEPEMPVKFLQFELPFKVGNAFQSVSPEGFVPLAFPAAASFNASTGDLLLFSRGSLVVNSPQEKGFVRAAERELELESQEAITLAVGGTTALVGRKDGGLDVLNAETLETVRTFSQEVIPAARFIRSAPDGKRFAITLHNGELWIYRVEDNQLAQADVSGQGAISSAVFVEDGGLLVADGTMRASRYDAELSRRTDSYAGSAGLLESVYQFGIVPIYTVFPKPGELDKTFQYLLTGEESIELDRSDLRSVQQHIDPWAPLWSSALFTLCLLAIACVYIEFQEF